MEVYKTMEDESSLKCDSINGYIFMLVGHIEVTIDKGLFPYAQRRYGFKLFSLSWKEYFVKLCQVFNLDLALERAC